MTTRQIASWGKAGIGDFTVRATDIRSAEDAAAARLARESGRSVITVRADGQAVRGGRVEADHYQITLGRRISRKSGGGYTDILEGWIAVKR